VSSKKKPDVPNKPGSNVKAPVSRRGFIRGVGLGSGAVVGAGVLTTGLAEPAAAAPAMGPAAVPITLKINGKAQNVTLEPRVTLLDALRNHLDITGAKRVCDRGTCGACTVIMNGRVVYSCTVLAIDAQGKEIQTIEGIAPAGKLHPVSTAFVNHDAQQCGYCTPGFVMAVKGFLDRHPNPANEAEVEKGLGGNLCRCGTYVGVRKAVLEAAKEMKGGRNA
jgi:xanthine dehydrogenase YagT iron-sulfur-binding subunit